MVLADLGVGRVKVGGVDLVRGQGAVREVVVEAPDVALRQPVPIADARPAIDALHELVAETEPQFGMAAQICERPDSQPGRDRLGHTDGVRVVEPEWPAHANAAASQRRPQIGLAADTLVGEDLATDGARVLGINVELVSLERVEEDLCAPQLAAVDGGHARVLE